MKAKYKIGDVFKSYGYASILVIIDIVRYGNRFRENFYKCQTVSLRNTIRECSLPFFRYDSDITNNYEKIEI